MKYDKCEPNDIAFTIPGVEGHSSPAFGLTKREYFAAVALQGLCTEMRETKHAASSWNDVGIRPWVVDRIVLGAVQLADALIEALNMEKP